VRRRMLLLRVALAATGWLVLILAPTAGDMAAGGVLALECAGLEDI
jgi:hypothetical protein